MQAQEVGVKLLCFSICHHCAAVVSRYHHRIDEAKTVGGPELLRSCKIVRSTVTQGSARCEQVGGTAMLLQQVTLTVFQL